MKQQEYDQLLQETGAIGLMHPEFDKQYHLEKWNEVTVLVCQRKTFQATRLCIESLLRFYPDINILVVDGNSQDDSTLYLKYKSLVTPNLTLHERIGKRHSHGETMDEALLNFIKTPYALLLDSDTIINRGGWIEPLLQQFKDNPKLYATGSLMLVTRKNYGVGAPEDKDDVLRYAHPSCAMIHVSTYRELKAPANDNGSPLAHNMIEAEKQGFEIGAFPIDKYVSHLSSVSWNTDHSMTWHDDYDVFIRPFITFVTTLPAQFTELQKQNDRDFNIVPQADYFQLRIWDGVQKDINNRFFKIRHSVNGEYVCLLNESVSTLDSDFVHQVKIAIVEQGAPDELQTGGLTIVKRQLWQQRECQQ